MPIIFALPDFLTFSNAGRVSFNITSDYWINKKFLTGLNFYFCFRETQSIIKVQKPDATFGEISKIVASMWDGLGDDEKTVRLAERLTGTI